MVQQVITGIEFNCKAVVLGATSCYIHLIMLYISFNKHRHLASEGLVNLVGIIWDHHIID